MANDQKYLLKLNPKYTLSSTERKAGVGKPDWGGFVRFHPKGADGSPGTEMLEERPWHGRLGSTRCAMPMTEPRAQL